MNLKKIGKYLQEKVEYVYFNCVFTCTYGNSWIDSVAGTSQKFIMWKGIVIWENGILEINPGSKGIEEKATLEILKLLDVEFVHALGSNNFDEVKDYYKILGIKSQIEEKERLKRALRELEEVDIIKTGRQVALDNIKKQLVLIHLFDQDEILIDNYENMFGINLNIMTTEEIDQIDLTVFTDCQPW